MLHTIETNVQRGSSIIGRVLGFARGTVVKSALVELKDLIQEVDRIMFETFPKSIRIEIHADENLWPVSGDPTQLHQALLNLAVNARDAMPDGGQLHITGRNLVLDAHDSARTLGLQPGPHVALEVADTGTGIPPEILAKIFDPFFTTKEIGKGTGLGLASTLAIVKSHHGHIRVESEPGKGTVFTICLPAQPEARLEHAHAREEFAIGNGELVLIIDDEGPIRDVAKRTLERFGYRTLLAENGSKGTALYAANHQDIAAVITDMMMPEMDGRATVKALRKINPSVKIIATSGLEASIEDTRHLAKPFTTAALLQVLHEILQ
jgi:CheY-like chemotaxis protein